MTTKRDELVAELDAKSAALAAIFEEAGPERDMTKVTSIKGDNVAKAEDIKKRNEELTDLGKRLDEADALEAVAQGNLKRREMLDSAANRPPHAKGNEVVPQPKAKGFGELLRENASYKAFRERGGGTAVIDLSPEETKTLIDLTVINNQSTRRPGVVGPPEEERTVRDLMLQGSTDNNTLTYMEETSNTPAADTRAEGVAKPEAAIAFTERTDNVRKIAVWIPATSESLADVSWLQSYIEGRLRYFIMREEEDQLLNGDGTAPNISGIRDRTGLQTQAKGGDPTPTAIYKAMQKVRITGFAEPTAVVLNPNDWTPIRVLTTADGIYIWGHPSEAGPERIFGKEMRQTTAMPENTGLVGAFTPHAQVFQREGITFTISTEHASYFVENKVAILAEERLALAVYRPSAFCEVTGI